MKGTGWYAKACLLVDVEWGQAHPAPLPVCEWPTLLQWAHHTTLGHVLPPPQRTNQNKPVLLPALALAESDLVSLFEAALSKRQSQMWSDLDDVASAPSLSFTLGSQLLPAWLTRVRFASATDAIEGGGEGEGSESEEEDVEGPLSEGPEGPNSSSSQQLLPTLAFTGEQPCLTFGLEKFYESYRTPRHRHRSPRPGRMHTSGLLLPICCTAPAPVAARLGWKPLLSSVHCAPCLSERLMKQPGRQWVRPSEPRPPTVDDVTALSNSSGAAGAARN